jgi:hypothetical protein
MDVPTVAELFKAGPPLAEDEQIGRLSATVRLQVRC